MKHLQNILILQTLLTTGCIIHCYVILEFFSFASFILEILDEANKINFMNYQHLSTSYCVWQNGTEALVLQNENVLEMFHNNANILNTAELYS